MENWLNFTTVIVTQLLLFIAIAFLQNNRAAVRPIILKSLLIGLIFGVAFDIVFGWYLGIFAYTFGFDYLFIIVNGILSYGIMAATVWLCSEYSFFKFYLMSICVGVVYEATNYFFPVWSWHFNENVFTEQFVLIFAAYCGLAALLAGMIQIASRTRLKFLHFASK